METIQNNVAQNLMAMFPMRPAELILQCVTHPRNTYEPVDEGTLLNRCIDDLLSREDSVADNDKVDVQKQEPLLLNEFVADDNFDFMVDDIPDGDPVVVEDPVVVPDPEVILASAPNHKDLEVKQDVSKKSDIVIDLTDDGPVQEVELDEVVSTEKESKTTAGNSINETDVGLPGFLGVSVQNHTSPHLNQPKTKSPSDTLPAASALTSGNPLPSEILVESVRKTDPLPRNQTDNAFPSVTGSVAQNNMKLHDIHGFQSNSIEHGIHSRDKTPFSTGMSFPFRESGAPSASTNSRTMQVEVGKYPGQELVTHREIPLNQSTSTFATSTLSADRTLNANSRPVFINGPVGLKSVNDKVVIRVGKNGNYMVPSSTPRVLTVRQELERKRAIPATLSRAPSDEMISNIQVPSQASSSNPFTPKTDVKEDNPTTFVVRSANAVNGVKNVSSTISVGSTGIPIKVPTPNGIKVHSKPATLSRAPSGNLLRPATTGLQANTSVNLSTPNLKIGSRPVGEQIRPVILTPAKLLGSGTSQGKGRGVKLNLPQSNQTANLRPTPNNSLVQNYLLVSSSSSTPAQGMVKQSNAQFAPDTTRKPTPVLPKSTINGNVPHNSAFNVVRQRPVVSVPQTTAHSQVQTPQTIGNLGLKQISKTTGGAWAQPSKQTDTLPAKNYADPYQERLQESLRQVQQLQNKITEKLMNINRATHPKPRSPIHLLPPVVPLHPPVQAPPPLPPPIQVDDPAGGLLNVLIPEPNPAPRPATAAQAMGQTKPATDGEGMKAASTELEEMVQLVMKMFPTADKTVVRGMLVEHRNVNATCNYLLENPDVANAVVPAANPVVTPENKETEKEIDYLNVDNRRRGIFPNYHQYITQGIDLLSNDFVKISKTSLRLVMNSLNYGSYVKTKKVLDDAIHADPNIQVMMRDDTKGSFFNVEKDGRKAEVRLMKKARKPLHIFTPLHPELQKEIDFYKKHIIKETAKADFEVALKLNEDQYEQEGQMIECGCCYLEVTFENMIQCLEGHLFCQTCLQRYTKEAVYGQGKATLSCLEDGCDSVFPRSQLEKTLTKEILLKYDERVVEESINMADMDNLLRCPNCNYAAVLDKDHKVFSCPECHKETCRNCKEPWKDHYGLECDQVKKQSTMRLSYQERMTEAKVRTCYKCGTKFTKSEGCNKMTCRCGAKMCYICRQPIKDYSHFDNRAAPPNGQMWMPKQGEKCRLWTNSDEDDNRAVKEIERQMKAEEKAMRDRSAADLKRPSIPGVDDGGGSDAKRPRTG
ncbi:uncharacterized protein LOC121422663 [Lytechinus variegatus]|uniref:uncharacterized protein LOC121422663 n=1 Tax=Lytechinus variegatus TaxID=7654 RepID=UPI001BB1E0EA|nr:uncharacterized protein LOC121422663 [Lytechinus variegatus]